MLKDFLLVTSMVTFWILNWLDSLSKHLICSEIIGMIEILEIGTEMLVLWYKIRILEILLYFRMEKV